MSNEHRTPEGTPAGGQFAVVARTEPALTLPVQVPAVERDADTALTRSLAEGAALTDRLRCAELARDEAGRRLYPQWTELDPSRNLGATDTVRMRPWVALCEDVADLRALRDSTAVGMAELQHTVRTQHAQALAAAASTSWSVRQVAADHQRAADDAHARLAAADTDPDLIPVTGATLLDPGAADLWADISMVAAPVHDVDEPHPSAYRVSFISAQTGGEVTRITLPTALCTQPGTRTPDAAVIASEVAAMARNPAGMAGGAASELVEHLAARSAA